MTVRKLLALPLAFTGGVILASFAGCTETNDNHCAAKGGDVFCQEKTGKAEGEVFCTNNCGGDYDLDGCLVAEEPPADGCWLCEGEGSANCGSVGDGDSDSTDTETTADTDSTDDATETMDTETTAETGPECMDNSGCPDGAPLCEDGACVGCGDAEMISCGSEFPETPACDAASGECVECTAEELSACSVDEPACEGGVCVPCDEHEQCPDSACNMVTGACMPTDRVWWVNQTVAAGGDGSQLMPYNSFVDALANVDAGELGTIYFSTPGMHSEKFEVFEEVTVALIGKSGGSVQFGGAATIDVNQGGVVFIHKMRVVGGGNVGIACASCNAWISSTEVVDNDDGGIDVQGTATVSIVNSTVGGFLLAAPAISAGAGTALDVLYSTVAGGANDSAAIICQPGADVAVRNSVLVALHVNPELVCADAVVTSSATEANIPGNVSLGDMPGDGSWFSDYAAGDLHLSVSAPMTIATAAVWQAGDPETDIDDDQRPTVEDSLDFAGADIPPN